MKKTTANILSTDQYYIYLRKSRADSPNESVQEVLAKHEVMLQELAVQKLGGMIQESCIIREVVSGETIDERPGMTTLLSIIESPNTKMVLCVDPQRLTRGDLEDCGRCVNAFRYSSTQIMTLQMTYDLTDKMHRKFFEQELMRGGDYLEYIREILYRGRILAIQNRGAYLGTHPPYGYDKARIDGVPSLVPNENADNVRLIYDLYINHGYNYGDIARHLERIGVKPARGEFWQNCTIRVILKNIHYAGKVRFGAHKTARVLVNGELIKKRCIPADPSEIIIGDGKHEAIIDMETYERAQAMINNNPRGKWDASLKNPLAGLIFCHKCGRAVIQHPYKHAQTRLECRNRRDCHTKSAYLHEVVEAVVVALEREQLPDLEARLQNNEGLAASIQQKQIQKMQAELEELRVQEEKQCVLLEKGIYSEEKFVERNKALHAEMDDLKGRIYEATRTMPKEIDYEKKIITLKKAIAGMRDDSISIEAKNNLLKAIVKRIEYEYIGWAGKGKTIYNLHITLWL